MTLPPGGIWRRSHRARVEGTSASEDQPRAAPKRGSQEAESMQRLTAEDRLMLWQDERWPQEIGALVVLDGACLPGHRLSAT